MAEWEAIYFDKLFFRPFFWLSGRIKWTPKLEGQETISPDRYQPIFQVGLNLRIEISHFVVGLGSFHSDLDVSFAFYLLH